MALYVSERKTDGADAQFMLQGYKIKGIRLIVVVGTGKGE